MWKILIKNNLGGKFGNNEGEYGEMALQSGKISAIGGEDEAKQWLKDKLQENVNVCDY